MSIWASRSTAELTIARQQQGQLGRENSAVPVTEVTLPKDAENLVETAIERFGRLDSIVQVRAGSRRL